MSKNNIGTKKDLYTKQYGKFTVAVYFIPRYRVIVYEMDGYVATEHIHEYIDDLLAVTATYKPVGMVADPRNMKVLSPEFQKAIQSHFGPAIAKYGVKRNPAIMPATAITQSSVKRMVEHKGEVITNEDGSTVTITVLESLQECL